MKLEIVIPTYLREEKLIRTLSSVRNAMDQLGPDVEASVKVCYSSEAECAVNTKGMNWPWIQHCLIEKYPDGFKLPRFWNDVLRACRADALCYLTDDVLLNRYCLAIAAMEIRKMNFDGVIGFAIENITEPHQPCQAAFGVIGMRYADQFKDRRCFCPDYTSLYADIELQKQAQVLGKFKFHTSCTLVHFHPAYEPNEMDQTHMHARRNSQLDRETFERRSERDLVWGLSEELING